MKENPISTIVCVNGFSTWRVALGDSRNRQRTDGCLGKGVMLGGAEADGNEGGTDCTKHWMTTVRP